MSRTLVVGVSEATASRLGEVNLPWLQFEIIDPQTTSAEVIWRRQHDRTAWLVSAVESIPQVRWVHTDTAGIDRLPLKLFASRGIALSNGRGAHTHAVSEWAFGAMLLGAKRMDNVIRLNDARRWEPWADSIQLYGRTVMILGMGSIGSSLGRLCRAAGMRVVGVSRVSKGNNEIYCSYGVEDDWMKELSNVSFLVNCLPSTALTQGFVSREVFFELPNGAWFINVGRGHSVDEHALVEVIHSRRLEGAVLDTVIEEPLAASSPLWHPNIVISPHVSSFTRDTDDRTRELFIAEAERYRRGMPPLNIVDADRGY